MSNYLNYFESLTSDGAGRYNAIIDFHNNARTGRGNYKGIFYQTEDQKIKFSVIWFRGVFEEEAMKVKNEVREIITNLDSVVKKFNYIAHTLSRIEAIIRDSEINRAFNARDDKFKYEESQLNGQLISVLENLDESLRREYIKFPLPFKDVETGENINSSQIQPPFEQIISEIKASPNAFYTGLPMDQVIKHFEVMTSRTNKNGQPYLTKEQFISFLKKGFLNNYNQPKQKINCSNGEKGFVIKRFYELFVLATSQYGHPQQKKNFISLFLNCFDNWEKETVKYLFKPNKTKEKW